MSSLWTPGGEHPVDPEPEAHPGADLSDDLADDLDDDLPDDLADAEMRAEIDEVRRQLAQVPPEVVVANHVMGLYELAAIHLSQDPPNVPALRSPSTRWGRSSKASPGDSGEAEPTFATRCRSSVMFVQVTGSGRAEHHLAVPDLDALRARNRLACSASCPGTNRPLARDHPPPGPVGVDRGQEGAAARAGRPAVGLLATSP